MDSETRFGQLTYSKVSLLAISDSTYKSDLQAALIAPTIYLKSPKDFEICFDKIMYHLENAMLKCTDSEERTRVQLLAQEIYHGHVFIIRSKIEYLITKNNEGVWIKLDNFFKKIFGAEVAVHTVRVPYSLQSLLMKEFGYDAVQLITEYFRVLAENTKLNNELNIFYIQMFRTFRKIIQTEAFKYEKRLIVNTIASNIDNIYNSIIIQEKLDEIPHFVAFLNAFYPDEHDSNKRRLRNIYIENNFTGYIFDSGKLHEGIVGFLLLSAIALGVVVAVYLQNNVTIPTSLKIASIGVIASGVLLIFRPFKRIFLQSKIRRITRRFNLMKRTSEY